MADETTAVADDETPTARPAEESKGSAVWREIKGLLWVLLAVLLFHSFVAKPFYIPSESMMPGLLKGDRLVVSKYPYGWSWVCPSFHVFPHWQGRLLGKMPRAGDIVIVTPPGQSDDYIKRVIGLPGDTVEVRDGRLILNGKMVKWEPRPPAMIPVDANVPCGIEFSGFQATGADGRGYCRLPIVRETLPNGVSYDTTDLGRSPGDDFAPGQGAGRPCLPDGRQPRPQRRQPLPARPAGQRPRRPGAVGEYRRARRVHHLLARRHDPDLEPDQLVPGAARRPRRNLASARARKRRRSKLIRVAGRRALPGCCPAAAPCISAALGTTWTIWTSNSRSELGGTDPGGGSAP